MVLSSSDLIWRDIERLSKEDRRKLLEWQLQAREPIRKFADIRPGDHLVRKSSLLKGSIGYQHHFLCNGYNKGKPKIIHYYNTSWNASLQLIPTSLASGSAIENLGTVQEMTLPHKDFIKSEEDLQAEGSEVQRVVWPDELRRYPVAEVIKRAEDRKGESWYNIVKNNCETFVMSCLCDIEISLQVTIDVENLCEAGSILAKSVRHTFQQGFKVAADVLDDLLSAASRGAGATGLGIGAGLTVLSEIYVAYRDICEAKKKWNKGVMIKSRKEFIKEVIIITASAASRSVGAIVGMIAGQFLIPVPLVGGLIGGLVGFLVGQFCAKKLSEYAAIEWLAERIDNFLKTRN